MKRNGLDITVLILGIACIGLMTVNRYIFRPVWKSEIRTELREVKSELKESGKERKQALKKSHNEVKAEMQEAKTELKETLSLSY
ncbi:YtxH domain-containing protein [Enterococcus hulanensis]|uniref:YtxH domain-containing protein n=1 Tax=Enterococcus hulanensis TaxID=2559929 RepID=UPI001A9022A2|nr:YtxH domain-containing protein [Enterococcus hulanensis]MBO0456028.1 YtxH domain-containing protein [Enterococcus hulanensis]